MNSHASFGAGALLLGTALCSWQTARMVSVLRRAAVLARATRAFSYAPSAGAPVLLVFGDSLAVGVGAAQPDESVAGLVAADFPGVGVVNHARSGARARDIARQARSCGAVPAAAAVWLSIGGNDILFGTPLQRLREQLDDVLATCRRHAPVVVVSTTANLGLAPAFSWPVDRLLSSRARRVRDLVASCCARAGAEFVDFFRERRDDVYSRAPQRFYARDGVHPSGVCYRHCYRKLLAHSSLGRALRVSAAPRYAACTPGGPIAMDCSQEIDMAQQRDDKRDSGKIEGEGSYTGAKQYNDATREFVEEGKVKPAARKAKPGSPEEAREMEAAEQAGKARAKEEDPALRKQDDGSDE